MTCSPDLTVVIPYYNRADTIGFVLESIRQARQGLRLEVLLVDDGSSPPGREQIAGLPLQPDRILSQENRGLLYARLAGLDAATGEFTVFLDSDDLVSPDKFAAQVSAMRHAAADVSYTDAAETEIGACTGSSRPRPLEPYEDTSDPAAFFIRVQPAPHSPVFRTSWLRAIVGDPLFPPSPLYNPVAEIWLYHVAAPRRSRIIKVAGPRAIIGHHPGTRLTGHWEKLGVASLAVMEAFMRSCPVDDSTRLVRQLVGEKAFASWRRLPHGMPGEFDRRMLSLWQRSPRGGSTRLGGPFFRLLARCLGPAAAGRLLRRVRGQSYARIGTLASPQLFENWLRQLPAP